MDKIKVLAMGAVVILAIAGISAAFLYTQGQEALEDKERFEVREDMSRSLTEVQSEAQNVLASVYRNLTEASVRLRTIGLNGTAARAVLNDLMANVNNAVDVVTIDVQGVIVAAEPAVYHEVEGTNISDQAQVRRMSDTMMPVMSDVFMMAEGFPAADMEVPVFTTDGRFNGSVSVALDMESMLRGIVNADLDTERFQFTCLHTNGLELYDTDEDQIGRNLFTDPAYANYTETLEFMHGITRQSQGYGTYEYYQTLDSRELVEKEVYWSSFGLYGAEWRLLVIHVL